MSKVESFFYAIQCGNHKLAHDTVQRLLKKSPDSVHYQLLECYYDVHVNYDFEAPYERAVKILSEPSNYNKLANTEVLQLLIDVFNDSNHQSEVSRIYEVLLKRQPSNKSLVNSWFRYSILKANVSLLQKSSFHMSKVVSDPQEKRLAIITAAFNYYLASRSTKNAMEKVLFPKLGLKLLEGLGSLQSDQEIFVQIKLLIACGQLAKVVEIVSKLLESRKLNEIDLSLLLIYLESLAEVKDYDALWSFTYEVIFKTQHNDFNFWNYLLLSAFELGKEDAVWEAMGSCESLATSRNLLLAKVSFAFLKKDKEIIKNSIFAYYTHFGNKKCAFDDLMKYFELPEFDANWFLDEVLTKTFFVENGLQTKLEDKESLSIQEVSLLVNLRKFFFVVNGDTIFTNKEECEKFVAENQKLYDAVYENYHKANIKALIDDCFIGNELLILNLQAELTSNFSIKTAIKYVAVLRALSSKSPKDFAVKLWLLVLYNYLNLPLLTSEVFVSLKVSNVQIDTLNHYLTTRVSSRFPTIEKYIVPVMLDNLDYFTNEDTRAYVSMFLGKCYDAGSFTKIEKFIEFVKRSDSSFEKYYGFLELSNLHELLSSKAIVEMRKRLLNEENLIKIASSSIGLLPSKKPAPYVLVFNTTGELEEPRFGDFSDGYSDNRDFSTLWEAGIGHRIEALEKNLNVGPRTGTSYLKIKSLLLKLSESPITFEDPKSLTLLNTFHSLVSQGLEEFTKIEALEVRLYHCFWKFCEAEFNQSGDSTKDIQEISSIYEKLFVASEKLQTFSSDDMNWRFAHTYVMVTRVAVLFNKILKAYKQKYPGIFNKKNKNHSSINGGIIANHESLLKKVKGLSESLKVHDKGVQEELVSIKKELSSDLWLTKEANIFKSMFESLESHYSRVSLALSKI